MMIELRFAIWHARCIIVTSGSFTFLCQPLRDVLHKLRMTHKQVPAVQLLIIAMLYQARAKRRVRHRLI